MSEITQSTEHANENANDAPIIVNIEGQNTNPLVIDIEAMSVKQLSEFERGDLLAICVDKNLLKDLKKWQIDRLSRPKLAKLLKDNVKSNNTQKIETDTNENKEDTQESFSVETSNIQVGLVQLLNGKEPIALDNFAKEVVSKSQYAVVSPDTVAKMEKYFYYASLGWLGYRKFFGTFDKLKAFYAGIKEKLNRKKEKVSVDENSNGQK